MEFHHESEIFIRTRATAETFEEMIFFISLFKKMIVIFIKNFESVRHLWAQVWHYFSQMNSNEMSITLNKMLQTVEKNRLTDANVFFPEML